MGIERERAVTANAVGCGQLLHVYDYGNEVTQTGLMEHGSFGLAGRAGGVYHISEAVGL